METIAMNVRELSSISVRSLARTLVNRGVLGIAAATIAVIGLGGLRPVSSAESTSVTVTPWSWAQYKQSYGTVNTSPPAGTYILSNPGLPTTIAGTALAYDYLGGPQAPPAYDVGTELRGFVLGDVGDLEPPLGTNRFRDLVLDPTGASSAKTGTLDYNGTIPPQIASWASPLYSISPDRPLTTNNTVTYTGYTVSGGTTIIDNTAAAPPTSGATGFTVNGPWAVPNGTTQVLDTDFYSTVPNASPYLAIAPVARPAGPPPYASVDTVTWQTTVATSGSYSIYAWFPSQTATGSGAATTNDLHINDANYEIQFFTPGGFPTTPAYQSFVKVDQTNGGFFFTIGGPFELPAGTIVQVILDNTADTAANPTAFSNGTAVSNAVVVADAIEIAPSEGTVATSPVAINVSDYPEIASGYAPTVGSGGTPATYAAGSLSTTTHVITGSSTLIHGGNPLLAGSQPITQMVFYGRTENTSNALTVGLPGLAQPAGALYAVDGLNGNIVWKFGGTQPTIDDTTPIYFIAGGFTSATTPDTGFYGTTYHEATATNGAASATATWALPSPPTTGSASYYVYLHWTTPGTGNTHVTDAHYQINGVSPTTGASSPVTIYENQTINGGNWVLARNATSNNGAFAFAAAPNNTVTLSNVTANSIAGSPEVIADAVMFVPVDAPGPVMSTPVVVHNMQVLVDPINGTTAARTCVIFADNSGRVFCVDAAGNGDGDDHIFDTNTNHIASFDASGNPLDSTTGVAYTAPTNFQIVNYGTTNVYWIWQPDPAAIVPRPAGYGTATAPAEPAAGDPQRDLPEPGPFLLNSPTVEIGSAGLDLNGHKMYPTTLYIGNSTTVAGNDVGVLYSLNATGTFAVGANQNDGYRLSLDPTEPTPAVNWWFVGGEGIAYAPAVDPKNNLVDVTTFAPDGSNKGVLYAINMTTGPIGDDGKGPLSAFNHNFPASDNYNTSQTCTWSFPDAFGTKAGDTLPAYPLGDIAGAPTIETIDTYNGAVVPKVLIAANEPGPPGAGTGNPNEGRVYCVDAATGKYEWAFPSLGADPDTVTSTSTYDTTFTNPTIAGASTPLVLGSFTTQLGDLGLTVSSSPVTGLITFPAAQPTDLSAYADKEEPMAYVGDLDGSVYALNLDGTDDASRFVYAYADRDGSPIYSTPALLPGSAILPSNGKHQVGGTLFLTTSSGNLDEIEATPYVYNGTTYANLDFEYAGIGGISSPSLAAFDSSPFAGGSVTATGDVEWVYSGSDQGYCYAFTPNFTSSGSDNFTPTNYIAPGDMAPPDNLIDVTRNFVSRLTQVPNNADYAKTIGPPENPAYDWGQTIYIQLYGVDQTSTQAVTPNLYPQTTSISAMLTTIGPGGKPISQSNRVYFQLASIQLATTSNPGAYPLPAVVAGTHSYVATAVYNLGTATNKTQTPGTKIRVSNIQETVITNASGNTQIIHGGVDAGTVYRSTTGLAATTPVDQATFTILNPIAVTAAAREFNGNNEIIRELGPLAGVANNSTSSFGLWQAAAANGNYIPLTPPVGGTLGANPGAYDPTSLAQQAALTPKTAFQSVALGLGDIMHGQSADSGTANGGDPSVSSSSGLAQFNPTDTVMPNGTDSTTGWLLGASLLNVADRSALGSDNQQIANFRTDSLRLGWNDNTGQGGQGSVINLLSWDTPPLAFDYGSSNISTDYPDIPKSDAVTSLIARSSGSSGGNAHNIPGSSATVTSSAGALTPSDDGGGAVGDPGGLRNIYPMPMVVQVSVPKYQPANLETYTVVKPLTSIVAAEPSIPETREQAKATDVPQGYVATARVFVDTNNNGRLDPGEAYRTVQVWIGVPVDMGMSVDEPTVDVGTVPAGFGNQLVDPTTFANQPWTPFIPGDVAHDPANAVATEFAPYFHPLTVRNNGNVNLMNVHFDQLTNGTDSSSPPNQLSAFLQMLSDQVENPTIISNSTNWTDSLSFIPSIDNLNGILTNNGTNYLFQTSDLPLGTYNDDLIRTSIDPDIYTPNVNEYDIANKAPGARTVYNPTLHKARVGSTAGSILTVPDEPIDSSNPAVESGTFPYASTGNRPVVSVAVPFGTPVGNYHATIRAFEGSDPYSNTQSISTPPYTSTALNGPEYNNVTHNQAEGNTELTINTGSPEQYFTDPGTTLTAHVTESRFTDGVSLSRMDTATNSKQWMALPNGDPGPQSGTATTQPTPNRDDLQPFAFRAYNPNGALPSGSMGLFFISDRSDITGNTFDLFSSYMLSPNSTTQTALSIPSGANKAAWWTTPTDETPLTVGPVRSPFVLNDGTDAQMAFYIKIATSSSSAAPLYSIVERDISTPAAGGGSSLSGSSNTLYTMSSPIFALTGVAFTDSGGSRQLVLLWHARIRGRASIRYGVIPLGNSSLAPYPEQALPVPASLIDVSGPSPVLRVIDTVSSGTLVANPDPTSSINGLPGTPNYLDVSYSGVSKTTGETDIYSSRYQLIKSSGTGISPTLQRVPLTPYSATPQTMTVPLTNSGANTGFFKGQDVDWLADPADISIYSSTSTNPIVGPPSLTPPHYLFDKASGQIVYTVKGFPWATTTPGSVYVNPGDGTVRFSVPPTTAGATFTAQVIPLASRITFGTRVNTEATSMLDDYLKDNAPEAANDNTITKTPHASRQWYIYRKSGTSTGDSAATNSALYYDTRRLTMDLAALDTADQTTSLHMKTDPVSKLKVMDTSEFRVYVADNPAMSNRADVTNLVDVDIARARIYFPSYMEGLYGQAFIKNQNYDGNPDASPTNQPPGYKARIQVPSSGGAQIIWQDEPYVNASNPGTVVSGERTLPMTTAVNESTPSAFVDPSSGDYPPTASNPATTYVPHRVWVFWSSTRNAAVQTPNAIPTGADIYYEAIDPKFEVDLGGAL